LFVGSRGTASESSITIVESVARSSSLMSPSSFMQPAPAPATTMAAVANSAEVLNLEVMCILRRKMKIGAYSA